MRIRKPVRSVTIKDIATRLHLSHATVSRALNDKPEISSKTKELVRKAAEQLGYVANLSARMIRGDASPLIGLVIPDVLNDFYSRISKELAERCRNADLRMLLAITEDEPEIEQKEIRALLEARVSGIIATLTSEPRSASLSMLKELPSVQLVRRTMKLKKPAVCMADVVACAAATEHLLCLGHQRIAYVGTIKTISTGRDRVRGFLRAHKNHNIEPLGQRIVLVPPRQAYGFDGVASVLALPERPTALVIGSSELTIGGLKAIREAGLQVPHDISVVGYGDPVWFRLLSPALTAVRLPVSELADAAARELFEQIDESRRAGMPGKAGITRIMPEFVVRASTAQPAAGV